MVENATGDNMKRLATLALVCALGVGCNIGGSLEIDGGDGEQPTDPEEPRDPKDPVDEEDLDEVVEELEIDVGRVTIHRLNRAEYNNTVRDLLGTEARPADDFPDDDFGYGFNNIADVLSLSPLHVEMYFQTAETLVEEALAGGAVDPTTERFEAEDVGGDVGSVSGSEWNLFSNGSIETVRNFEADGEYTFRVSARQTAAGPDDALMSVTLNGQPLETFEVAPETLTTFEVTAQVDAGAHAVGGTFENDYYDPDIPADRNLLVDWFEVEGPIGATGEPSEQRAAILTCDPAETGQTECASEIIRGFGERAWRRPMTDAEVQRLGQFVDLAQTEGDDFETGIKLALQAILVSPNFIFRVETDPDPSSEEAHALSHYEMASRLSYFLWSTMPDDELFQLAEEGQLQDEAVLREQVQRMLDDPKSQALVDNFATQWLFIDVIQDVDPDYQLFADFDDELRSSMRTETRMLVSDLIEENADVKQLLLADYTYMDGRLAEHYDMSSVSGEEFQRVELEGEARRGLLGHGGLLTSLSFPTRTSPVKRGAWVLGNLLCSEPPAPPPGVENLPMEMGEGETLREQMEAHSSDPACSACHQLMDPIGFGMENYDAIGAWRDQDNGQPVDSSGELPDGTMFNGAYELAGIIAADEKYTTCTTEKLLTYALGRGIEHWDEPQLELLAERLGPDFGFRDLITEIVLAPTFRMRRGGALPETN
jgi:hypothetical protein